MNYYWYDDWGEIGNVGDRIAPIILEHLLGHKVVNCMPDTEEKLMTCGSVIEFIQRGDVIFGAGLIQPMELELKDDVKIFMVRGPNTMNALLNAGYDVPEIYGSPAFLLPEIIKGHENKEYKTGVVCHYVDDYNIKGHKINVLSDPVKFINEICKCERIISSSLHGIIIAEAYGIPATWVKLSDKIIGGEFKFNDYYLGTGREPMKNFQQPLPNINITKIKEIWNAVDAFIQTKKLR